MNRFVQISNLIFRNIPEEVLNVEWPQMNRGSTVSTKGRVIIDQISQKPNTQKAKSDAESRVLADMLVVSRNLYDARLEIEFN